jgi:AraC-like DNA-binding protein
MRGEEKVVDERVLDAEQVSFSDGERERMHVHPEHGQLKWPSSGLASVRTPRGIFVSPPAYAVWIPVGQLHGGMYGGSVVERNIHVAASHCTNLPTRACLVRVSGGLALGVEAAVARHRRQVPEVADDLALLSLLGAEVRDCGASPLELALPDTLPIVFVLESILAARGASDSLSVQARRLGVSPRTLHRMLLQHTGISPSEWRGRARVLRGLQALALGAAVADAAGAAGYGSQSAFTYAFRRLLGTTPARYYS